MKKLTLIFVAAALVGCASTTAKQEPASTCQVKGHDCWQVAQLLDKTQQTVLDTKQPQGEGTWQNNVKYENPDLAAKGITVTQYIVYRDGGSTVYILDEEVAFFTNRRLGKNPQQGYVTVTFKESGEKFLFNEKGKLIK
jgi:hypothetical protein